MLNFLYHFESNLNVHNIVLCLLSREVFSIRVFSKRAFKYSYSHFSQMSSTVTQQRMEVEQLRREAAMKRIPVSQAVDDIKVKIDLNFQTNVYYQLSLH